jgi:class 3 adenylate cyclase
VSHLILADPWMTVADYKDSPAKAIEESLRDKDWHLLTETFAQVLWRYEDPALATLFAELTRASCSQEAWQACWPSVETYDASHYVGDITAETLVLHNKSNRWVPIEGAQRVAASIAKARLLNIDDMTFASVPALAREFVLGEKPPGQTVSEPPHSIALILFADIANSTALTERLGDASFRSKARDLDDALRNAIAANGGTAVDGKLLGDGVLATLGSAREAISCAQVCHEAAGRVGLPLHVGLHAGDVIREGDNVFGGAVNIAARVADQANAGETIVSGTVRDLARTSAGVSFEDRGERELKGVSEPVRVFAVQWREDG